MKRSFLRCHLMAWIAAVVFAYIGAGLLTAIPPKQLFAYPFIASALPVFAAVTLFEFLIAWRVAVLLGAYDLLLIIAGALTVALGFGFSYTMDVHAFLPDNGHTFFDVLTWGARPFDFRGQLLIFSLILGWAFLTLGAGIILKRIRESQRDRAGATMFCWLGFDVGLIALITVAVLRSVTLGRIEEGTPHYLSSVLDSPDSTPMERIDAVQKLSMLDLPDALPALRRASKEQSPPLNLMAASALLNRGDVSALPLLEPAMMQASQSYHAEENQTRGWGISHAVSGTSGTMNFGSSLYNIKDPTAVPALTRLMTSTNLDTRRGAAHALNNISSPQTIDTLVAGLKDDDIEVRFNCATALAKITGEPHYPFRGLYGQNEKIYLDHWKAWASARDGK